jgi:hypothetical protein
VWQDLHDEFRTHGVDVTLVALDAPDAAAPFLEPLRPDGPRALVDEALLTVEAFGWVNVPSALWYDETGAIVREPEVAFIKPKRELPVPDEASDEQREAVGFINAFDNDAAAWLSRVRDWVVHGASSSHVRSPEQAVARSRAQDPATARAAAHYALAEHLRHAGELDAAIDHFAQAHQLDPEQWNHKRQAWAVTGGPERFGTSFLDQMRRHGPASFYPVVRE